MVCTMRGRGTCTYFFFVLFFDFAGCGVEDGDGLLVDSIAVDNAGSKGIIMDFSCFLASFISNSGEQPPQEAASNGGREEEGGVGTHC